MRLITQGCLSKERACAITTQNNRPIITSLRKKLAAHGVALVTLYKFGGELPRKAREKVFALLARSATNTPAKPLAFF